MAGTVEKKSRLTPPCYLLKNTNTYYSVDSSSYFSDINFYNSEDGFIGSDSHNPGDNASKNNINFAQRGTGYVWVFAGGACAGKRVIVHNQPTISLQSKTSVDSGDTTTFTVTANRTIDPVYSRYAVKGSSARVIWDKKDICIYTGGASCTVVEEISSWEQIQNSTSNSLVFELIYPGQYRIRARTFDGTYSSTFFTTWIIKNGSGGGGGHCGPGPCDYEP